MFKLSCACLQAQPRPHSEIAHSFVDWDLWHIGHINYCSLQHNDKMMTISMITKNKLLF